MYRGAQRYFVAMAGVAVLTAGCGSNAVMEEGGSGTQLRVEAPGYSEPVATFDNRNWELRFNELYSRFNRSRAIAIVMVIATMLLLLVVMTVTATINMIQRYIPEIPAADVAIWRVVDFAVTTVLIAVVFGAILKWVPDVRLRWRHVWKGALISAVLFSLGRLAIGFYLGRALATSIYGAAASLFVALVAVFFAVLVLLLAAEITEILGRRDAEFEEERKRAQGAEGYQARKNALGS